MTYRSTITHTGTFKMFLTKPGYDPSRPLKWSDLPERPFAEVKDPAMTGDAYRIGMTLPSDRSGRQVLYTIWQNSSTADTYYSCSDVVFPAAKSGTGGAEGRQLRRLRADGLRLPGRSAQDDRVERPGRAAGTGRGDRTAATQSADSAAPQAAQHRGRRRRWRQPPTAPGPPRHP